MKHTLNKLSLLLLLFAIPPLSLGEEQNEMMIENGRVTGTATAVFANETANPETQTILLDFDVPNTPFIPEIIQMEERSFSKQNIQNALHTIGQPISGTIKKRQGGNDLYPY